MKYLQIVFLLSIFLFTSCKMDNPTNENPPENENKQTNFVDMKVGDTWKYIRFEADGAYNENDPMIPEYVEEDSLILKIVDKVGNRYKVNEKIIYNEVAIPEYQNISYWLEIVDNRIEITDISNSFYSGLFGLFVDPNDNNSFEKYFTLEELNEPVFVLDHWYPIGEDYVDTVGVVKNYDIMDINYDKLNYTQILSPTYVDGPGHFWLYSKEDGIVRKYMINPWMGEIIGWDLITE